jgi:hypothetical protein
MDEEKEKVEVIKDSNKIESNEVFFTISEKSVKQLYSYLQDLPFKYANSIMQFLNNNLKN